MLPPALPTRTTVRAHRFSRKQHAQLQDHANWGEIRPQDRSRDLKQSSVPSCFVAHLGSCRNARVVSGTRWVCLRQQAWGPSWKTRTYPHFGIADPPRRIFELWQHTGRALFRQDGGIHTMGLTMCMAVIALSALTALFAEGELFG